MPTAVSHTLPRIGELRSPIRTWALSIATLGVYAVVHHYTINRELRDFGVEVRPLGSLLALVPGALVVVPPFITLWRTADRIAVAQETVGLVPSSQGRWGALSLLFFVFAGYHQHQLNLAWSAEHRPGTS